MTKVRTDLTQPMFYMMLLFVILVLCPIAFAEEATTDDGVQQDCSETKCGCDEMYIYNAVNDRCMINFKKVMKRVVVNYESGVDVLPEDEMAKKIYIEGEQLFKRIIIAVILFMTCASICVVSACIYCCRINFTDRTLKQDVKALAKKLKRDYKSKKMAPQRPPLPPVSESCSVVVESESLFVA